MVLQDKDYDQPAPGEQREDFFDDRWGEDQLPPSVASQLFPFSTLTCMSVSVVQDCGHSYTCFGQGFIPILH